MPVTRDDVLRYRVHAQGLDATESRSDCPVLDIGVQDTGPDASGWAGWALAVRRCTMPAADLVRAWTLRGAPHAYRRSQIAQIATATAPFSEQDARKRTLDAGKKLMAAGLTMLDGLERVAAEMRDVVAGPTAKGDVSRELSARLPPAYLRFCRACNATHIHEMPFRLAALQAGLELQPGTSPPVLRRIPGWHGPDSIVAPQLDPIRAVLHLLGPATPALVAGYLDSALVDVLERWPKDAVAVDGAGHRGQARQILEADRESLATPPDLAGVRLLGAFDLFLQGRDRELILPDEAARKELWRTLGRPGAVLEGHEIVGSWRPRSSGRRLRLAVTIWSGRPAPAGIEKQAEQLAAWRGQDFSGFA